MDGDKVCTATFGNPSSNPSPNPNSTVTSDLGVLPADGTSVATLTVTLRDMANFPLAGHGVTLDQGNGGSTITPSGEGISDAAGRVQFTVTHASPEVITYRATDSVSGEVVAQAATVTFFDSAITGAIIMVTVGTSTIADDGACSLSEAITAANTNVASGATPGECVAGDAAKTNGIVFALNVGDVTLTTVADTTVGGTGLPAITSEMIIAGGGRTIQRNPSWHCSANEGIHFRILYIASTGNLTLRETTISQGCVRGTGEVFDKGGGIYNDGGTLTLEHSGVSENRAFDDGGGLYQAGGSLTVMNSTISGNQSLSNDGGGIFSGKSSSVTLINSTVSGNIATNGGEDGGGIFNSGHLTLTTSTVSGNTAHMGAGIFNGNTGIATLEQSTVSGNTATGDGGGLYNKKTGTVTLEHSTVAMNTAGTGGGLYISDNNADIELSGSLIAGNSPDQIVGQYASGPFTNLIHAGSDVTPILDPTLANNGGPTHTHDLTDKDSPAVDAAGDCGLTEDQRGESRPVDGDGDTDAACDIGAVEWQVPAP